MIGSKTWKLAALACAALALLGLSTACGDGAGDTAASGPGGGDAVAASPSPTASPRYDIYGGIRQLTVDTSVSAQEQGILGSMLVVAAEGDTVSAYDRASVAITTETRIWRPVGEGAEDLTIDDLAEGDTVIVTFTGPVAESYPVQATAESIVVVPGL